jgi:hypothetical protein
MEKYYMNNILTNKQKQDIIKLVTAYLNKHKISCGEAVPQDDNMQIDAIKLACDLADIASFSFYE